jgi:hypothetical protein
MYYDFTINFNLKLYLPSQITYLIFIYLYTIRVLNIWTMIVYPSTHVLILLSLNLWYTHFRILAIWNINVYIDWIFLTALLRAPTEQLESRSLINTTLFSIRHHLALNILYLLFINYLPCRYYFTTRKYNSVVYSIYKSTTNIEMYIVKKCTVNTTKQNRKSFS